MLELKAHQGASNLNAILVGDIISPKNVPSQSWGRWTYCCHGVIDLSFSGRGGGVVEVNVVLVAVLLVVRVSQGWWLGTFGDTKHL